MNSKRTNKQPTTTGKKIKISEFDKEVKKSSKFIDDESSNDQVLSESSEFKVKSSKKNLKKSKKKLIELSESESDQEVKVKKSEAKLKKKAKPSTSKKETPPKSPNKKVFNPPERLPALKKVSSKKGSAAEDPSSLVKTEAKKFPVNYHGTTYYTHYLPNNFQKVWDGICEMRDKGGIACDADIDRIGYRTFAKDKNFDERTKRYHTLVALQLSSQTEDKQIYKAMEKLKSYGLNVEKMAKIDFQTLDSMISNTSFHPKKTGEIQSAARILIQNHGGDVPRTKADLMSLPGIGAKTANLAMTAIWNENCGVSIDTSLSRVLPRLGWVKEEKNRDKQTKEIESWLPKVLWDDLHDKIKGFGQTVCLTLIQSRNGKGPSKAPRCSECTVNKYCKFYLEEF